MSKQRDEITERLERSRIRDPFTGELMEQRQWPDRSDIASDVQSSVKLS